MRPSEELSSTIKVTDRFGANQTIWQVFIKNEWHKMELNGPRKYIVYAQTADFSRRIRPKAVFGSDAYEVYSAVVKALGKL